MKEKSSWESIGMFLTVVSAINTCMQLKKMAALYNWTQQKNEWSILHHKSSCALHEVTSHAMRGRKEHIHLSSWICWVIRIFHMKKRVNAHVEFLFHPSDPQGATSKRSTTFANPAWHRPQARWQGLFRPHRCRAPPAYTAQLLTLHQHRADNQSAALR